MLYPHRDDPELSRELFRNPTSEYRGTPFWAWNCELDEAELRRQIGVLEQMGMGGFHMHCRTGMATEYLSDDFMKLIRACADEAEDRHMLAWLYDEDRWPSGAAGGLVTKDRRYSARYLLFTPTPYGAGGEVGQENISASVGARMENGTLLARYAVRLQDGCLMDYRRLDDGENAEGDVWYAYLEVAGPSAWYNNQTYLNTIDPAAVRRFVEVTHEAYKRAVGDRFGGTIPAIFTDEPQFTRKQALDFAGDHRDVTLPFTDDFPETFRRTYGADILDSLPELFWDLPDGQPSLARYRYHDHLAERFAAAFADTVGGWCRDNGIMLTGHMMDEPTLESQTGALGEAMRSYRSFQLPGIDMLCDRREFTTAKQAQSAARQFGCPGVLSELYGVTNWDFDFRGHKLAGDWQAALGVTVRVHHLAWVSMGGGAKRDYPASINYQSPWYAQYRYVEDYFGRVNTALTRGEPEVRVGVVHPVESYWLHWGPREQTADARAALDSQFESLCTWLLTGLVDFDYIAESLLPGQCPRSGAPLQVGQMAYDTILVPGCETIRSTTLDRLEAFRAAGGRLIFVGRVPQLVDAQPSDRALRLAEKCLRVAMEKQALLAALEPERFIEVRKGDGARSDDLLYQLRRDGEAHWLFLCHAFNPENRDVVRPERLHVRLKGCWHGEVWNCMTGAVEQLPMACDGEFTRFERTFHAHDSLLLRLLPGAQADAPEAMDDGCDPQWKQLRMPQPMAIHLEEPNVLVLDQAQFSLDGEPWQMSEELLRVDNIARLRLNRPQRMGHFAQPWVTKNDDPEWGTHTLALRFFLDLRTPVSGAHLALEESGHAVISLDGDLLPTKSDGWYVDHAIHTIPLPPMEKGVHALTVTYDYGRPLNIENLFLLGNFGVTVEGSMAHVTALPKRIAYGDITRQSLPFYGGNLTYEIPVQAGENGLKLKIPQYRGAVVDVALDGVFAGKIAYAPYECVIPCAPGEHRLQITVYGNRVNTFNALHNCNDANTWYGPDSWRSTGDEWCYEYRLKPCGLLIAPMLYA